MTQTAIPRWQLATDWVFSGLLAIVFLPSACCKILLAPGTRVPQAILEPEG
jgi:hypothetical protein